MKLGLVGDIHANEGLHLGKVNPETGRNSKLEDLIVSWAWTVNEFRARGVSEIVLLGDLFDNANPSSLARTVFSEMVDYASHHGVKRIYVEIGNHDLDSKKGTICFSDLALWTGLSDNPRCAFSWGKYPYDIFYDWQNGVVLFFLPYYPPSRKEEAHKALQEIEKWDPAWIAGTPKPIVKKYLFLHDQVEGALVGNGQILGEDILPSSWINFDYYDRIVVGHVHQAQVLYKGKVVYVGSFHRTDLAETKEDKCVGVLDLETSAIEKIVIPHPLNRNIIRLDIHLTDKQDEQVWNGKPITLDGSLVKVGLLGYSPEDWKGATVSVTTTGTRSQVTSLPRKKLADFLYDKLGVFYLVGGIVTNIEEENPIEGALDPSIPITVLDLLREAIRREEKDKAKADALLQKGIEYLNTAKEKKKS